MKINYGIKPKLQNLTEIIENSIWDDSMIWCPSQCSLTFVYENQEYIIYLRWRHCDPWTADLIINEEWIPLNIGYFEQFADLHFIKSMAIIAAIPNIFRNEN